MFSSFKELFVGLLSLLLGCLLVVQASMNIHLGAALGHPIRASCVSFLTGTTICALIVVYLRMSKENSSNMVEKNHVWDFEM